MKKITLLFLLFSTLVFSQNKTTEISAQEEKQLLKSIDDAINDTLKLNKIIKSIGNIIETKPILNIKINQKLLLQARKDKNKIKEAKHLSTIGYCYMAIGNKVKSTEYNLKAVDKALETNDTLSILNAKHNLAHSYNEEQSNKKIEIYSWIQKTSGRIKAYRLYGLSSMNLGHTYLTIEKLDLALENSQKAYETFLKIKDFDYLGSTLNLLGKIHNKLGNNELAESYFKMAEKEAVRLKSPRFIGSTYSNLATHYYSNNQLENATFFAKKSYNVYKNSSYYNLAMRPTKLLADIYAKTDNDSTLKYLKIYVDIKDSVYSTKAIQEIQLMTVENEMKQKELAEKKLEEDEQNQQNLQLIFIAIGIITLIIIFLLLSRSFITNTKLIQFFGVIGLLIVFEFLNLILHPFLGKITHHSPVLMLLAMVGIAALLVPLHHRVEHWATNKLVEKNKQIRLANAKKVIEQLETES